MKKKIGDLTIKEVRKICRSIKGCPKDCPLALHRKDDSYDCGAGFTDNMEEDLDKEVEVEE